MADDDAWDDPVVRPRPPPLPGPRRRRRRRVRLQDSSCSESAPALALANGSGGRGGSRGEGGSASAGEGCGPKLPSASSARTSASPRLPSAPPTPEQASCSNAGPLAGSDPASSSSSSSGSSSSSSTTSDGGSDSRGETAAASTAAPAPAVPSAFSGVGRGTRNRTGNFPFGADFFTPRYRQLELTGYQMTCNHQAHNIHRKCTWEMTFAVARGSEEVCKMALMTWSLLGNTAPDQEQHDAPARPRR